MMGENSGSSYFTFIEQISKNVCHMFIIKSLDKIVDFSEKSTCEAEKTRCVKHNFGMRSITQFCLENPAMRETQ